MAKKGKREKKRVSLQKVMLDYYQSLSKEAKFKKRQEERRKKELKRQGKKAIWGIIFTIIISLIIAIVSALTYELNLAFSVIIFGLVFIIIFTTVDLVITKNEERNRFNTKLIFEIITIFILLGQFSIGLNQNNILNSQTQIASKQTEILDRTSQSNLPQIMIYTTQTTVNYNMSDILLGEKQRLELETMNIGKSRAPYFYITPSINNTLTGKFGYLTPFENGTNYFAVFNLENLGSNHTIFNFEYSDYNKNLSAGYNNITFEIHCPACVNSISYQNVPIYLFK